MSECLRSTKLTAKRSGPDCRGFTLTELMMVVGLISVIISLLFPVIAKVRVAANTAKCASNLHQMGVALSMYVAQNHGRAPEYEWHTPATPDVAWHGYWLGILDQYGVNGNLLICPSAAEPNGLATTRGYGDAWHCWTGRYASNGSVVRFSSVIWRDASYGYNRYLTVGGFGGRAASLAALHDNSSVAAIMDCVYADTMPLNGSPQAPAAPPPDLSGTHVVPGSPEHWKFLISRHGRGINVSMADGSVSWVALEQTYMLRWNNDWVTYALTLPPT